MWARIVEMMTAVWLALSPFIFRVQDQPVVMWVDNLLALLISILAGLSYWKPTRHAHVLILLVAVGMIIWARFGHGTPPPPIHQNHMVVGILLLMIAIVPNEASQPSEHWRSAAEPSES